MTGTPGRPLSAELSEQLVSVAVDILADEGWGRLNSDRVAARARAGKAGIYRRWPTMAALARHALGRFDIVPAPVDHGSLRGDLAGLISCWTLPLTREERAVASVVGAARHEEELRAGLEAALVRPLGDAVGTLGARAAARGEAVQPARLALLGTVLEAFWWQRFTSAGDGAITEAQVRSVVDDVLMPIAVPGLAASADRQPAAV
jgi:AcrR family transcriptional regulator